MESLEFFKDQSKEIVEIKTFQGVPLLDKGQVGRATCGVSSGASEIGAGELKARIMPVFAKVLHDYVAKMNYYFDGHNCSSYQSSFFFGTMTVTSRSKIDSIFVCPNLMS